MRYSKQIKPISYLKANAAEVLQVLEEQRKPMIITQLALLKILALGGQQVGRGEISSIGEVVNRLRSKVIAS
jgi:hypothetical protein